MNKANVVVVTVSYQSASFVIDCLQSVQNERALATDLNIKMVVVDNASGDTPQIAEAVRMNQWSDWVTVLTAPRNGGFGYGNNFGVQYALANLQVDFFYFLNPDTVLRQSAIPELVNFLNQHPQAGIAGSCYELLDGEIWPYAFRFPTILSEISEGMEWGLVDKVLNKWKVPVDMQQIEQPVDWISGASMMMPRSAVEQLKGFDESYFLYFEETDLCLRARRMGIQTWYVPSSRVMHNSGQSTKVTLLNTDPKRLPDYWYESRRRYFIRNHGVVYAIFADLFVVLAKTVGILKSMFKSKLLGNKDKKVPYFIRDVIKHSPIFPGNRKIAPLASMLLKPEETV